jgi:hypothetical protein
LGFDVLFVLGVAHSRHQHLSALAKLESKWRVSLASSLRCYEEWKLAANEEADKLRESKQSSRLEGDLEKLQRFVTVLGAEDLMVGEDSVIVHDDVDLFGFCCVL